MFVRLSPFVRASSFLSVWNSCLVLVGLFQSTEVGMIEAGFLVSKSERGF